CSSNLQGVQVLFFLDEPRLSVFSSKRVQDQLRLQELKLIIQALQKEDVLVGIHCCSNTDWEAVLSLGPDVLSLDTELSLSHLLQVKEGVRDFLKAGGCLSLGLIPTSKGEEL